MRGFLLVCCFGIFFAVTSKDSENNSHIYIVKLGGRWQADEHNRLMFNVQKEAGVTDRIILRGAWEVNKQNEIMYTYEKSAPEKKGKITKAITLKTKTGIVPMSKKGERTLGGHAICAVGYDEGKGLVKFKNSWSEKWGEKGYGYLSFAYIERYMMDAWSSVDIEDPNPLTLASIMNYRKRALG